VVGCRWVYALKRDAAGNIIRYKACLVAQGFSQVPGVDFFDTYAPVAKLALIRTALAYGAQRDYEIHQVDVKNAYLNTSFVDNEVIYMRQPPELSLMDDKKKVLRLLRPLYGLCQLARDWYKCVWGVLKKNLNMEWCEVDQAVFYWREGEKAIVIVAHVDDLTILTSSVDLMKKAKEALAKEFKISDEGEIHWILGFAVKHDRERKRLSLSQVSYIDAILNRFGFEDVKPTAIPMDLNTHLSSVQSPQMPQEYALMKDKPYREAVASLMYLALGS
jgi:hypothetical protein